MIYVVELSMQWKLVHSGKMLRSVNENDILKVTYNATVKVRNQGVYEMACDRINVLCP